MDWRNSGRFSSTTRSVHGTDRFLFLIQLRVFASKGRPFEIKKDLKTQLDKYHSLEDFREEVSGKKLRFF